MPISKLTHTVIEAAIVGFEAQKTRIDIQIANSGRCSPALLKPPRQRQKPPHASVRNSPLPQGERWPWRSRRDGRRFGAKLKRQRQPRQHC